MTAKQRRDIEDRSLGEAWAIYALSPECTCSAWAFFVLKSSGDVRKARRRWEAADMDGLIRNMIDTQRQPRSE